MGQEITLQYILERLKKVNTEKLSPQELSIGGLKMGTQFASVTILLAAIWKELQASNLYYNIDGGINLDVGGNIGDMVGGALSGSLTSSALKVKAGIDVFGWSLGGEVSYSGLSGLQLNPQFSLDSSFELKLKTGIPLIVTVSPPEYDNGEFAHANVAITLGIELDAFEDLKIGALDLSKFESAVKLKGGAVLMLDIRSPKYDFENITLPTLRNHWSDIVAMNARFAQKLNFDALKNTLLTQSTGNYLSDLAKAMAQQIGNDVGEKSLVLPFFETGADRRTGAIGKLTDGKAVGQALVEWNVNAEGIMAVTTTYGQSLTEEGRRYFADLQGISKTTDPNYGNYGIPQLMGVERTVYYGADGKPLFGMNGLPLETAAVFLVQPDVDGAYHNLPNDPASWKIWEGSLVLDTNGAAAGGFSSANTKPDGGLTTSERLKQYLDLSRLGPSAFTLSDQGHYGVSRLQFVDNTYKLIVTPQAVATTPNASETYDPDEIVVTGRRLPGNPIFEGTAVRRDPDTGQVDPLSLIEQAGGLRALETMIGKANSGAPTVDGSLSELLKELAVAAGDEKQVYALPTENGGLKIVEEKQAAASGKTVVSVEVQAGKAVSSLVTFTSDGKGGRRPIDPSKDIIRQDSAGKPVKNRNGQLFDDGDITRIKGGSVLTYTDGPLKGVTRIQLDARSAPLGFVQFDQAGALIGEMLGTYLIKGGPVAKLGASVALKTIGQTLGGVLNGLEAGASTESIGKVLESFGPELLNNLGNAAVGALSSYIVSEIVGELGIGGLVGDIANKALSETLRSAVANVIGLGANNIGANVTNAVGSMLGAKLAGEVIKFDTIGGQIGSAIGSSLGSMAAGAVLNGAIGGLVSGIGIAGTAGTLLAGALTAGIGAFVGFIFGGLIGSVFGGTPRSGADVVWDAASESFVVANAYSRKGAPVSGATSLASAASGMLNEVLGAAGGKLLTGAAVQGGNYGTWKSDLVYRPTSTRDQSAITERYRGSNAAGDLISSGVLHAFSDPDFRIAGGDVYVKRALYATIAQANRERKLDTSAISGNIAVAGAYQKYLINADLINAMVSAETDSNLAIETALMLSQAAGLGLNRRAASDWYGGFSYLLEEVGGYAANVEFALSYDSRSERIARSIQIGSYTLQESIDLAGTTLIDGGAQDDVIDLSSGTLIDRRGFVVDGAPQDNVAASGSDFAPLSTVVSFAPEELRKSVYLQVNADSLVEKAEYLLASLRNASGMRLAGGETMIVISADDQALPFLLVGNSYAHEGDGYATFRLSLSRAASESVSVSLALLGGSAVGGGQDFGAAGSVGLEVSTNGIDWTTASIATFDVGVTELFARTAVTPDNGAGPSQAEARETFSLEAKTIAGASALANGADPVRGTGNILDGDSTEPLVWIDPVIVSETGPAQVFLSRSRASSGLAQVELFTHDKLKLELEVAATVDAGGGNDTIFGSDLGDTLYGGAGNDTIHGGRLDDWLVGGDGADTLDAGGVAAGSLGGDGNYLDGGAGNDVLRGREGSDWLDGGADVDQLDAGAGDDILAGGAGDGDWLRGGSGSDQFIVRRGDGHDFVEDGGVTAASSVDPVAARIAAIELWKQNRAAGGALRPNWSGTAGIVTSPQAVDGGEDALVFSADISIGDVRLQRSAAGGTPGADLIVVVTKVVDGVEQDSGTSITLKDWFANSFKRVEWLKFVDGTAIRISDIASFVTGGSGNDVLIGTDGNDFVYGGSGDDQLFLLTGNDVGNGGTGNDMVSGGAGRDLVIGGLGRDQLLGGAGADALSGDNGADDLYGGADADILSGGRGDGDTVVGGAGDDRFKYARGDGRDTILDDYAGGTSVVWANNAWGAGYTLNATTGEVAGPSGDIVRKNVGTAAAPKFEWVGRFDYDPIAGILRRFENNPGGPIAANNGNDTLEFAADINLQDIVLRQAGNDLQLLVGDDDAELTNPGSAPDVVTIKDWYSAGLVGQIENLAFYQTGILEISVQSRTLIAGSDGSDGNATSLLAGTSGSDWITGGGGDDWIAGGHGDDILAGNSGADVLRGEVGEDVLYGGTGNDILDGGSGADVLVGGAGFDTASYTSATAAVRVQLSAAWANGGDAAGDEYLGIEGVTGGAGADVLGGDDGDNEISGGGGADTLNGGAGDDTYVWNSSDGADVILDAAFVIEEAVTTDGLLGQGYTVLSWASTGLAAPGGTYWRLQVQNAAGEIVYDYDRFIKSGASPAVPVPAAFVQTGWLEGFARTNGQQVTRTRINNAASGGTDVLELGAGLSLSDLTFIWSGADLIIRRGIDSNSQVVLQQQTSENSRVETLQLSDGFAASLANVQISQGVALLNGTGGDDLLVGAGGSVAAALAGGGGNDVLVGYAGADQLFGGAGDDTLEGGAGGDTLDGGTNSAVGSTSTAGDTVRYVQSSAAVSVDLRSAGPQSGGDAAGDALTGIENLVGSAWGDTLTGDAGGNRLVGLAGDDILRGNAGDDVLLGDAGTDLLYGDAGIDSLAGGEGNDSAWGGDEGDLLDGGDGDDQLYGEAGNDTLTAGRGGDTLDGGAGNDTLVGGDGNDGLYGGDGNDTLRGDAGTDMLSGGLGDDTYLFDRLSGSDTITDTSGINVVNFGADVGRDQLWMARSGNDLKISVLGTDASVVLAGFFATSGATKVRTIQAGNFAYYLDNTDSLRLITMMTQAATAGVPTAMPAELASQLDYFWHAGGKAAPTASTTPIQLTVKEDLTTSFLAKTYFVDHDSATLSYAVKSGVGQALGQVTLSDPATGRYRYTPAANASGTDTFTMVATDGDGQSVELQFSIAVTPVNDAPVVSSLQRFSVRETGLGSATTIGSYVGTVAATDVEGSTLSYQLLYDSTFSIDSATGRLTVKDPTLLDYELGKTYSLLVAVSDGLTQTTVLLGVDIQNANDANALLPTKRIEVAEGAPEGTPFGEIVATDGDLPSEIFGSQRYAFRDGQTIALTSRDGRFVINAFTGEITAVGRLDFEGGAVSATYEVIARDNAGNEPCNEASSQVTIVVADVNEANHVEATSTLLIDENAGEGALVGKIVVTDADLASSRFGQQQFAFRVGEGLAQVSADGRFAIDAETGEIHAAASMDYERGDGPYPYTVVIRDNRGDPGYNEVQTALTIRVRDVNEANWLPTSVGNVKIAENAPVGSEVTRITVSDPDLPSSPYGQQRYQFAVAGGLSSVSADGRYVIEASTGLIRTNTLLDLEGMGLSDLYVVVATDNPNGAGSGVQFESRTEFRIEIADVNEAPTDITYGDFTVAERDRISRGYGRPATWLSSFTVADPDFSYSQFGNYGFTVSDDRFEFIGNSLWLKQDAWVDFETEPTIQLTIFAQDRSDHSFSISKSITVHSADAMDTLEGDDNANILTGQQNRDSIYGLGGNDTIDGGAGDDQLMGYSGDDRILGGSGNDYISGDDGEDTLLGGDGNDILEGGSNDPGSLERLYGGAGNDRLSGGAGRDWLVGGAGADILQGGEGEDYVAYNQTDEGVFAQEGVTAALDGSLAGTGMAAGDNYSGVENLVGSAFADHLVGDVNDNLLGGLAGDDALWGRSGDDTLQGGDGADTLQGGDGNDLLEGGAGNDVIYGGAGNDHLFGGDGDDQLFAEYGDDELDGGLGNDRLEGGLDNDTYIITRTSGADDIYEFDPTGQNIDVIGVQNSNGDTFDRDLWFERSGNDLIISIIGTTSSATVKDWYVTPGIDGSNYKIDFLVTGDRQSRSIDLEGLVTLMAGRSKPANAELLDALMEDVGYQQQWATYWRTNVAPTIGAIDNQTIDEDGVLVLRVQATDDSPAAGIRVSTALAEGGDLIANGGVEWGMPDSDGWRTLKITPKKSVSGRVKVSLIATDAGGMPSVPEEFELNIRPVASTPKINSFVATPGNAGQPGGIPIYGSVSFGDMDGSELHELLISGLPTGLTLSAGTFDSVAQAWRVTGEQLQTLRVIAPANWSRDVELTLTARASEAGGEAIATARTMLVINGATTGLEMHGAGLNPLPSVGEFTPTNNPAGSPVGVVTPVDPDAIERNRIGPNPGDWALRGTGEERVVTTVGPGGGSVTAVETGQFNGASDQPGGGTFGIAAGAIDPTRMYKYSIYVKAENDKSHQLYFGTAGNVENATTGASDTNPYFWHASAGSLVQDRWYRIDGYVLPQGSGLVPADLFGGVYDTVTGQKVADTNVFRFAPGATATSVRFFSYYAETQNGYSAQWHQPGVEQQDYAFSLSDNAGGRFTIDPVTGLVRAIGSAFDYETVASYNVDIRVRDSGGAETIVTKTIAVQPLNEKPNLPDLETTNILTETTGSDSHAGSVLATFGMTDVDGGPAPELVILSGNDNGWFTTSGNKLKVAGANWSADWLRANKGKYGTEGGFFHDINENGVAEIRVATLSIAAKDANGLVSEAMTYHVFIENKNEAPAVPSGPEQKWLDETALGNNPANRDVAVASYDLSDPDGPFPTLELATNPGNWFYLDGTTVRIKPGVTFDFETLKAAGYAVGDWNGDGRSEVAVADIVVRAFDGTLRSSTANTRLYISDVNEAPTLYEEGPQYLDEAWTGNRPLEIYQRPANAYGIVATFYATDPDKTTPTLELTGNPGGWFYRDGNSVRLAAGRNLDFETLKAAGYQIADRNGDGRSEAYIGDVVVRATDGALYSASVTTPVYIQDVNERPNTPDLLSSTILQETTGGASHAWQTLASLSLIDPDGATPELVIVGGNDQGWFQTNGQYLQVTSANWTADWLRANKGNYGTDSDFNYDANGNGLSEIRVATLTLAARDASGLLSNPFTYDVLIEDKNEAPLLSAKTFTPFENALGAYAYVGTMTAQDVDDAQGSLRYKFDATGFTWDTNLARNVSRTADGRFVMDQSGRIYVNGSQSFDFDHGVNAFDYAVTVSDRLGGSYALTSSATASIRLQNVDEQHEFVSTSVSWNENLASTPYYGVSAAGMLVDQDGGGGITYTFSDGSLTQGRFTIDANTGAVSFNPVDYESITTVTETYEVWDEQRQEYVTEYYNYNDPALATFSLGITAHSNTPGIVARTGTLTLTINNVNEKPIVSTMPLDGFFGASSENQIYQDAPGTLRIYRRTRARFAMVTGWDPDLKGVASFQILGGTPLPTSISPSAGSDSTIGSNGIPQIYIDAYGYLSMYVPGDSKNEWRGGYNSQKVTLTYNFTVRVTDLEGEWQDIPINITMFQRNIDIDPIVIDLDGDGVELIGFEQSNALFDMDDDGVRDATAWVGGDDGMLALDRNGNGRIDGRAEISFRDQSLGEETELEALQRYDTNRNGLFDEGDADFAGFLLWRDSNGNGTSDDGELQSLAEAGIASISLTREIIGEELADGSAILSRADVRRTDGSATIAEDVELVFEPSRLETDPLAAPIIFDFDKDGKTIAPLAESTTLFDMAGDGHLHKTAWADAGDGFLVRDRNGNGMVDGIGEISFVSDKAGAKTDLEGLAGFDVNGDEVLDANDPGFVGFGVWIDSNADGKTDAGELRSLAQAGIMSIGLTGTPTGQTAARRLSGQSVIFNTATYWGADGTAGSLSDVGLAYDAVGQGPAPAGLGHGPSRLRWSDMPDDSAAEAGILDSRLALMRQAMSGFGAGSSAETRLQKHESAAGFDFYAASAA